MSPHTLLGLALAFLLLIPVTGAADSADSRPLVVGSKAFTEGIILGDIVTGLLASEGLPVSHRRSLGTTRVVWEALRNGEVDVYTDYTGTLIREVLAAHPGIGETTLEAALAGHGIGIAARLGFNDTFILGMRAADAERLGIRRISDLRRHPELRVGLSSEFMDRGDGWPALRSAYGLSHQPRGMQHELAYRGLAGGSLDVMELYSTDAEIDYYGIRRLEDDRGFFPRYDAIVLYRLDLPPQALSVLRRLEGMLDADTMVRLNAAAKLHDRPEQEVAAVFLRERLGVGVVVEREERWRGIAHRTVEHLQLVGLSLGAAILVALPLGVVAFLRPRLGETLLAAAGIVQTIPSLALLVFMIPWLGIGARPAIAALFLYSLLPILRNTVVGLRSIPADIRDSAIVLGLPTAARLRRVELPLAGNAILAGIKIAAVINVGTATLGALIGAGGYGEPILTGIRRDDMGTILEGAIPAALLALLVQGGFEAVERRWLRRISGDTAHS